MTTKISIESSLPIEIHVYKYRWIILLIFGLVSVINTMQIMQFTIIANIMSDFYDVSDFWVDLTNVIFFASYTAFFYPVNYCIENYSMKYNAVITATTTLLGNTLKVFATEPDKFWFILLAQLFISIGHVQICSLPSKLATIWFGGEEVSTACALLVLSSNVGTALGCVVSPFLVTSGDNTLVSSQLFKMFVYQAIATGVIFLLVLIFFRSKPKLPPSQSQFDLINMPDSIRITFWENVMVMGKNKNVWYLLLSLGLANGIWDTFGVLTNKMYLHYFPDNESDVGLIGLLSIVLGGSIGCMLFGVLLDKTHQFKRSTIGILLASSASIIFVTISYEYQSRIATFCFVPIFGFFVSPVINVGFEFLVEVTYPIPEECSNTIFNIFANTSGIFLTFILDKLLDSVPYVWTFVAIFGLLMFCAIVALLVQTDLKRRDANAKTDRDSNSIKS